jgi:hypothetical protein
MGSQRIEQTHGVMGEIKPKCRFEVAALPSTFAPPLEVVDAASYDALAAQTTQNSGIHDEVSSMRTQLILQQAVIWRCLKTLKHLAASRNNPGYLDLALDEADRAIKDAGKRPVDLLEKYVVELKRNRGEVMTPFTSSLSRLRQ